MSYELKFKTKALKEWEKLDGAVKEQFKKKLKERLEEPHIPSAKLTGMENCYKIKLRGLGYRLVYQVNDQNIEVTALAVGKRDKEKIYKLLKSRF